jgi:phosphopantetheinyl transferase
MSITQSRINLWAAPISTGSVAFPGSYFNILNNYEKQKYHRFLSESDRQQYLVSHVLLRKVLSHTTGGEVDPCHWRFTQNTHGKLAIDTKSGLPALHFNLSHSRGLAVVAVSLTCPVGVDIEPLNRTIDSDCLFAILSSGERAWLKSRPHTLRGEDFTRIWTVKEAYAKLLGMGFSLDFTSFEVALDPVRIVQTESGGLQPGDHYLETRKIRMPYDTYHLSLVARYPSVGELTVTLRILSDLSFINVQHNALINTKKGEGVRYE